MPVIQSSGVLGLALSRGKNAFTLREKVKRRVFGYTDDEYLQTVNEAYQEVWSEVMQIDEMYFSDYTTVTTKVQTDVFDFMDNKNGALNAPVQNLQQIHRIRVMLPGLNQFLAADPTHPSDFGYMAQQQLQAPANIYSASGGTGNFLYVPYGDAAVRFGMQVPIGTQIEVWHTYGFFDMQILGTGVITANQNTIMGQGTTFTQMLPPDCQEFLPNSTNPSERQIGIELISGGQCYKVVNVDSDIKLETLVNPNPQPNQAQYLLATVPEFAPACHNVIADVATKLMFSTPEGKGDRFQEWDRIAGLSIQRMKNTLIARQRQQNPKKGRFPYATARRSRTIGVR